MPTDLPPRKFEIDEYVWANINGLTFHSRIRGYEDGRDIGILKLKQFKLASLCPGWLYRVRPYGTSGEILKDRLVKEEDLKKMNTTSYLRG